MTDTNANSNTDININDHIDPQISENNLVESVETTETADSELTLNSNNSQNLDSQESEASTTENEQTDNETTEPQMKKVDIVIAGNTYPIYCPINEEEALRSAVYVINNSVLDIKEQAPNLTQENLLVLCCLNLQEKIHSQQKDVEQHYHNAEQSEMLLNKIIEDAESVLL